MLERFQEQMRRALLSADDGAVDLAAGSLAQARLNIYRANVQQSLVEALAAAFPVTVRLMGVPAFRRAALAHVRRQPPDRPQLSAYGGGLPGSLVADHPMAGNMARLEWAVMQAYFAADAVPLTAEEVAAFPPGDYAGLCFTPHPAARLVWLDHAVLDLWRSAQEDEDADLSWTAHGAEEVLVLRPGDGVLCVALPPGAAAAIQALLDGRPLADAAAAGLAVEPELDLQEMLRMLLANGALAGAML
ncbi:MAG: DNA-binding domain-containing protein [Azospirillaceae bacterium]|nr:DNA-binding domain-containing protein [Azospirillaceae bacterium]